MTASGKLKKAELRTTYAGLFGESEAARLSDR